MNIEISMEKLRAPNRPLGSNQVRIRNAFRFVLLNTIIDRCSVNGILIFLYYVFVIILQHILEKPFVSPSNRMQTWCQRDFLLLVVQLLLYYTYFIMIALEMRLFRLNNIDSNSRENNNKNENYFG